MCLFVCRVSDPFASSSAEAKDSSKIHVRMQQRNGRKCITTIQGLADDLDFEKIARALKKTYKCNGSVTMDPEYGEIIQLSGDQRANVRDFFTKEEVCHEDQIVIHGG
jgi:translation initiation factor 1